MHANEGTESKRKPLPDGVSFFVLSAFDFFYLCDDAEYTIANNKNAYYAKKNSHKYSPDSNPVAHTVIVSVLYPFRPVLSVTF